MSGAIVAKEVHHSFGEKAVLKNINLEIKQGEIFGLLGPSGAGKTTLINILTGQLCPKSGKAELLGIDSRTLTGKDYQQIGIMMDSLGLYERMSCYDNLKFFQMLDGGKTAEIEKVLEQVGLLGAKKTAVMNLSKGMRNRLSFARALLRSPKIMFLDEPTSGLDPMTTEAIHQMILQEKERGTTIFLTTHNMHEAEKLCDHIALLNEGNIVEYGVPQDICRRYNHQKRIRIHLVNGRDVELLHTKESGRILQEYFAREEIETIHSTEPNLETVFMELTGKVFDK
uniref:ABC transporter ATP-binding protein n=1 Tax=Acetatifactor sp. TaxID=1872090 RepID=UPI0040567291